MSIEVPIPEGLMHYASDIAKHLIGSFTEKQAAISNLKLQKLLYYCQGWHLGLHNRPLFPEAIEAWVHGPVVPSVFREYRDHKWSPILGQPFAMPAIAKYVENIIQLYGAFDAATLERLTHSEEPWKDARIGLAPDAISTRQISHESMRKYFASQLR